MSKSPVSLFDFKFKVKPEVSPRSSDLTPTSALAKGVGGISFDDVEFVREESVGPITRKSSKELPVIKEQKEMTISGYLVDDGNFLYVPQTFMYAYDAKVKNQRVSVNKKMEEVKSNVGEMKLIPFKGVVMVEDSPSVVGGATRGYITKLVGKKKEKKEYEEDGEEEEEPVAKTSKKAKKSRA